MPLAKRQPVSETTQAAPQPAALAQAVPQPATIAQAETQVAHVMQPAKASRLGGTRKAGDKAEAKESAPMTKDDYWRRREERDIQRDKDMAWSGLAQACLSSVGLIQFNTENTVEGLVALVVKTTELLLQARDKRNN